MSLKKNILLLGVVKLSVTNNHLSSTHHKKLSKFVDFFLSLRAKINIFTSNSGYLNFYSPVLKIIICSDKIRHLKLSMTLY